MNEIISVVFQTAIVGFILSYIGKATLDKLLKRSEELENLKAKSIENNVLRIEKAHEKLNTNIKDLEKHIDDLKISVIKIHHKIEVSQEKQIQISHELEQFITHAGKVIKDVEKSNIIELGKTLQMIKNKNLK